MVLCAKTSMAVCTFISLNNFGHSPTASKKIHVTFHVFDRDARALAGDIRSDALKSHGLPKSTHFDRIDVSNIFDPEYVGIPNVLADWAPLLNKMNQNATILGYSMNWVPKQPNAQPQEADLQKLTDQLVKMGKVGGHVASQTTR